MIVGILLGITIAALWVLCDAQAARLAKSQEEASADVPADAPPSVERATLLGWSVTWGFTITGYVIAGDRATWHLTFVSVADGLRFARTFRKLGHQADVNGAHVTFS